MVVTLPKTEEIHAYCIDTYIDLMCTTRMQNLTIYHRLSGRREKSKYCPYVITTLLLFVSFVIVKHGFKYYHNIFITIYVC